MDKAMEKISAEYGATVNDYLAGRGEAALTRAYILGRRAIDSGLGVLAIAAVHKKALEQILSRSKSLQDSRRITKVAEDVFTESLAPFEMAQRGFKQANSELRRLNSTLEEKVAERTRQLREKDQAIRQAYVDVFSAVTGGRLIIMTQDELRAVLGPPLSPALTVRGFRDLAKARRNLSRLVDRLFSSLNSSAYDLILAANEALANTVKHGGGGCLQVFCRRNNVQIHISDQGPGIDFSLLPKAVLWPGFSTTLTLGVGFTIMLDACDRLLLATEPGRTDLVLEKSGEKRVPAEQAH